MLLVLALALSLGLAIASMLALRYCLKTLREAKTDQVKLELRKFYRFAYKRLIIAIYCLATLLIVAILQFLVFKSLLLEIPYVLVMSIAGAECVRLCIKFSSVCNLISAVEEQS